VTPDVTQRVMHHVLIGSGIAALSAAESNRRVDAFANITMVSPEADVFYSRPDSPTC